jgi:hypothetical protein
MFRAVGRSLLNEECFMKKILIAASALAAVISTSAYAQTNNEPTRQTARKTTTHVVNGRYMAVPQYADPYTVIENDRVVGRDPDLSIRTQLRRDFVPNEY